MGKLLQLGADPAKLYEQFGEREKQLAVEAEDAREDAQRKLYERAAGDGGEFMSTRDLRHAIRAARHSLVTNPDQQPGEGTYQDFRRLQEAEERGEKLETYTEYASRFGAVTESAQSEPQSSYADDNFNLSEFREKIEEE